MEVWVNGSVVQWRCGSMEVWVKEVWFNRGVGQWRCGSIEL